MPDELWQQKTECPQWAASKVDDLPSLSAARPVTIYTISYNGDRYFYLDDIWSASRYYLNPFYTCRGEGVNKGSDLYSNLFNFLQTTQSTVLWQNRTLTIPVDDGCNNWTPIATAISI